MFTHVVMFKLKESTDAEKLAELLRSMNGRIPHLRQIEVGVDEIGSDRSYDVVLITRFDSRADMDAYQTHPYHQNEILPAVGQMVSGAKAVDYISD